MKMILSTAAVAILAAGCSTSPNWDATFGSASNDLKAAQTWDGKATARNGAALASTDGKAVAGAQTKYSTSMGYAVKEATPPIIVVPTTSK
jgi:hypothetical protein